MKRWPIIRIAFLMIGLWFGSASPAGAQFQDEQGFARIVINDAIGASGARAYASPFRSVVSLSSGNSFCTGTLIAPNVVLSARHCRADPGDSIVFGSDLNSPLFTVEVASVFNPGGDSGSLLGGNDLSILTLSQAVPDSVASPMRLTDQTHALIGMEASLIGYGYNGLGSTGHDFASDDTRWGGTNVIDRYGSPASAFGFNIFSADFDDGSTAANTISGSSLIPTLYEATTAPGDSGGPLLVQLGGEWVIAGVLSGGTTADSRYGDISWWTGVAPFRAQLEAVGAQFYTAVPEVHSLALLILIGTPLMYRRRHRGIEGC